MRWPLSPMCPHPQAVGTLPTERTHLHVSLSTLLFSLGTCKFAPDTQCCSVIASYHFPVPGNLSALQVRESALKVLPGPAVVGGMRERMDGRRHLPSTLAHWLATPPHPTVFSEPSPGGRPEPHSPKGGLAHTHQSRRLHSPGSATVGGFLFLPENLGSQGLQSLCRTGA